MTYVTGLLAVSLLIYLGSKLGNTAKLHTLYMYVRFFKLQYFLAGIILNFILPANFLFLLDELRVSGLILCTGAIGMFFGCGLEIRTHQEHKPRLLLSNLIEPVLMFPIMAVAATILAALSLPPASSGKNILLIALFASFTMFKRQGILYHQPDSQHHPFMDKLLPLGNVLPVAAFAILGITVFSPESYTVFNHTFSGWEAFLAMLLAIGLSCGMILNMLIAAAPDIRSMGVILAGGAALTSGLASTFSLSPLVVGTLTGSIVINSTLRRLQVLESLRSMHEIIEKIYMFLIGTLFYSIVLGMKSTIFSVVAGALILFACRSLVQYLFTRGFVKYTETDSLETFTVWAGFTGQGILASAALFEISYLSDVIMQMFICLLVLLLLNQAVIGIYMAVHEKGKIRREGSHA